MTYPITDPKELIKELEPNKRTIFYSFGLLQHPEHSVVQLMTNSITFIIINRQIDNYQINERLYELKFVCIIRAL